MTDDPDRRVLDTKALSPQLGVYKNPEDFSTNELLRAMGAQLKAMRSALTIIAVIAFLQATLIGLWLFGVIEIGLKPASRF